jgi:hypothetical protein
MMSLLSQENRRRFFEGSLQELKTRNPGTNTKFQKVDSRSFESIIYINGKQASKCGIWLGDFLGFKGSSSIMYSSSGLSQGNSQGNSLNSGLLGTGVGVLILLNELVAVEGIFAIKCLATVSMFWIISRNADW